ncbi:phosphoglycolate phosphatase [Parabacteroides sp. PFB2-10]|uniref:HAD family hydrolase n=1 Tax=Parabacteroides sp. PFB2-10 TaxID=1742405 RepID=UPI0024766BA7|nr:HAD family hydrolase [Parabacteroides sp. PFB2-10]MDH6311700.1 phosphoglycolate phosphatase [Parabacteroides sp. PFB2-10]MDL2244979.1 HAD family hydrolase [Parabacteroides sp. OttesenSCG-928-J18]
MIQLVIFDLDGTLLNTIADLADSTNYALNQHHFPLHPTESYRFFVGNGINKLFERALPEGEKTIENIANIRKSFLAYYSEHNMDRSEPYPGIPVLLQTLHEKGIKLAVASNKYHEATCELIKHYFPHIPFAAVFGQREGITPKPDPTIVHDILAITHTEPGNTLYVGDSGVDMQTANNSRVTACGVTWGFRPRAELEQFHPHHIVDHPEDILRIIR